MTSIKKDIRNNWSASSEYTIGNGRVLQVNTSKVHNGQLVTRATVHKREGAFYSHAVFQDFSACLMTSSNRCTEKNVTTQHTVALNNISELIDLATAHYPEETAYIQNEGLFQFESI